MPVSEFYSFIKTCLKELPNFKSKIVEITKNSYALSNPICWVPCFTKKQRDKKIYWNILASRILIQDSKKQRGSRLVIVERRWWCWYLLLFGQDVYRCCEVMDVCETGKVYAVMKSKTNVGKCQTEPVLQTRPFFVGSGSEIFSPDPYPDSTGTLALELLHIFRWILPIFR